MTVYELWFKGSKVILNSFVPKKEHKGRFTPDEFIVFVENFIQKRRLELKNLCMYAVIAFDSLDEDAIPTELHDLETWAVELKLVLLPKSENRLNLDIENFIISQDSSESIFTSFKLSDEYVIHNIVRDARNRSMYCVW